MNGQISNSQIVMVTFLKNDKNPRAIFRGFSLITPKVMDRNPWKSGWYLILSYFVDWHWVSRKNTKIKKTIFYLNGAEVNELEQKITWLGDSWG